MRRFVAHRVGDKNPLRLIQRFLKAGVLEDGAFSASEEGTPQGNLVSPVLSNIYLLGRRLKSMRHFGAIKMQTYVRRHVQGHLQYYGVSGNSRWMRNYVHQVQRLLFKWLNRRSQRRSFDWARYDRWVSAWMPRPRIVHTL